MEHSRSNFAVEKTDDNAITVPCPTCERPTSHVVMASVKENGEAWEDVDRWSVDWVNYFQVIRCLGCDTASFRQLSYFSEERKPDGRIVPTERLYPRRTTGDLKARDLNSVPNKLREIYKELIDCFDNRSFGLFWALPNFKWVAEHES